MVSNLDFSDVVGCNSCFQVPSSGCFWKATITTIKETPNQQRQQLKWVNFKLLWLFNIVLSNLSFSYWYSATAAELLPRPMEPRGIVKAFPKRKKVRDDLGKSVPPKISKEEGREIPEGKPYMPMIQNTILPPHLVHWRCSSAKGCVFCRVHGQLALLCPPGTLQGLPVTVCAIASCVRSVAWLVWDTVSLVTELLPLCFPQQSGWNLSPLTFCKLASAKPGQRSSTSRLSRTAVLYTTGSPQRWHTSLWLKTWTVIGPSGSLN